MYFKRTSLIISQSTLYVIMQNLMSVIELYLKLIGVQLRLTFAISVGMIQNYTQKLMFLRFQVALLINLLTAFLKTLIPILIEVERTIDVTLLNLGFLTLY